MTRFDAGRYFHDGAVIGMREFHDTAKGGPVPLGWIMGISAFALVGLALCVSLVRGCRKVASKSESSNKATASATKQAPDPAESKQPQDARRATTEDSPPPDKAPNTPGSARSELAADAEGDPESPPENNGRAPGATGRGTGLGKADAGFDGNSSSSGGDPAEALKKGRRLRDSSRAKARSKNYGAAYADASDAWDAVRRHPGDADCAALAKEIYGELAGLGEQANQQQSQNGSTIRKPLLEK